MFRSERLRVQKNLPVLPLRDVVVYPHLVIPLFVGRARSVTALEEAMANDKQILLVAQRKAEDDDPTQEDLHQVATVASVLQLLRLPDRSEEHTSELQSR